MEYTLHNSSKIFGLIHNSMSFSFSFDQFCLKSVDIMGCFNLGAFPKFSVCLAAKL